MKQEGSTTSVLVKDVATSDWERFADVARSQNRSRSAQIRELIRREVEQFESLGEAA